MLKLVSDELGATVRVQEEILDYHQFERKDLIELETRLEPWPVQGQKAQSELKLPYSRLFLVVLCS